MRYNFSILFPVIFIFTYYYTRKEVLMKQNFNILLVLFFRGFFSLIYIIDKMKVSDERLSMRWVSTNKILIFDNVR